MRVLLIALLAAISYAQTVKLGCFPSKESAQVEIVYDGIANAYEVQFKKDSDNSFWYSITTSSSPVYVVDLKAKTTYIIRVRMQLGEVWGNFTSSPISCTTRDIVSTSISGLAAIANTQSSVTLKWNPPLKEGVDHYIVLLSGTMRSMTTKDTKIVFDKLTKGQTLYFTVVPVFADGTSGQMSDSYETRTLGYTKFIQLYRISELCDNNCEVDFLTNHDSGDLSADVMFISHAVATTSHSAFKINFTSSVTTQYCVEYMDESFADYLSCNGPTVYDYTCLCDNYIDRVIGRMDVSTCNKTSGPGGECKCDANKVKNSLFKIGQQPVYYPFPKFTPTRGLIPPPPINESTLTGYWYSTPIAGRCNPSQTPGVDECSWKRHDTQIFARGYELEAAGFREDISDDYKAFQGNVKATQDYFAELTPRCCGC